MKHLKEDKKRHLRVEWCTRMCMCVCFASVVLIVGTVSS